MSLKKRVRISKFFLANTEEEKEEHLLSDHAVLNYESGKEHVIGLGGEKDCFDLHQ